MREISIEQMSRVAGGASDIDNMSCALSLATAAVYRTPTNILSAIGACAPGAVDLAKEVAEEMERQAEQVAREAAEWHRQQTGGGNAGRGNAFETYSFDDFYFESNHY